MQLIEIHSFNSIPIGIILKLDTAIDPYRCVKCDQREALFNNWCMSEMERLPSGKGYSKIHSAGLLREINYFTGI